MLRIHPLSALEIFKLSRAEIADGRMPAFWVVEAFNVIEDIGASTAPMNCQTSNEATFSVLLHYTKHDSPPQPCHPIQIMRILLAEDDSVLADGLTRSLRQSGYATDCVRNGEEADAALSA